MAITFVAGQSGTDTPAGVAVVIPGAVAAGHRLLAFEATNSVSGYSHTPPPGWSLVTSSAGTGLGGDAFGSVFTKVAASTDHGTTVEFPTTPSGSKEGLCLVAYAGSVTTPEIVAAAVDGNPGTGTPTSVPSPDVTVDTLPTVLVAGAAKKGGTVALAMTPPAGFVQRATGSATGGGAITVVLADMAAAATGSTTVADWATTMASVSGIGILLALAEGEPPPMAAPTFHRWTVTGWVPPLK
jgi:hypothetical protein